MTLLSERCRAVLVDWWGRQRCHPLGPANKNLADRVAEVLRSDPRDEEVPESTYVGLVEEVRGHTIGWSQAKSPAEWQKQLGISGTTWRSYINNGTLVVNRLTTKKVCIRMDTLQALKGRK